MVTAPHPENEQARLWNGTAGRAWVETQAVLDQMFKPLEDLLLEAVVPNSGNRILDVGCGTGSTTLALAHRLGAEGHCTGIDISQPMIAAARARAEAAQSPASFIVADAQHHAFEAARFDLIVSRFGVMFFDDPVRAFANLRLAAKDNAELRFVAWRSAADNPFMTTAERAAAPMLPKLPARQVDAPGQFAFADPHRMRRILEAGGWGEIDIQAIDVACAFPEQALLQYLSRLGPVGLALQAVDEQTRVQVINTVRVAFDAYVQGAEVRFDAACWKVVARAVPAP